MAALHNQAMATTLANASDARGAVQSALIAAELAVKSVLSRDGQSDDEIRRSIGHDLSRARSRFCEVADFTELQFSELIEPLPDFVQSRYLLAESNRADLKLICRSAQKMVAVAAICHSGKDIRDLL